MTLQKLKIFFCITILSSAFSLLLAGNAQAAKLFFEQADVERSFFQGDNVHIKLIIDTREQAINAVEGVVKYPADILSLSQTSQTDSILSYWVDPPKEEERGRITFSGLAPGGYTGTDGIILAFDFMAQKDGIALLDVENLKVLMNDGRGTELSNVVGVTSVVIEPRQVATDAEKIPPKIIPDNTAPEEFVPAVSRHPDMFEGRWFVSFYAKDGNSGVGRYEIIESAKRIDFDKETKEDLNWKETESPHVLADQNLSSYVYIKAIDGAGNERIASIGPRKKPSIWSNVYIKWGLLLFIGAIIGTIVTRKILKQKLKARNG